MRTPPSASSSASSLSVSSSVQSSSASGARWTWGRRLTCRRSRRPPRPGTFDHLIKTLIPTSGCLLQSIDGSLKFAYLVSIFRIDKTFGLHHIQLFINVSIEECCFDIHLPYLIIIICSDC